MVKVLKDLERLVLISSIFLGVGLNSCKNINQKQEKNLNRDSLIYKIDSLNDLGWDLKEDSSDSALFYFNDARKKAEKINYKKGIADSYNCEGAFYSGKGDYESSKKNYLNYLKVAKEMNDSVEIGKAFNNVGTIFHRQGNYDDAVEFYINALNIYDELGSFEEMTLTYNNLGMIFHTQGNSKKALKYFSKDSVITNNLLKKDSNNVNLNSGFFNLLNNMASIFLGQKDYEKALKYYDASFKFAIKSKNKSLEATLFNNFATCYKEQGDLNKSFDYFEKSKSINEKIGNKFGLARNLIGLAEINKKKKNFEKSLDNLKESENILKEIGNLDFLNKVYFLMSQNYEEEKDFVNALKYSKFYSETNNSLFNLKSLEQIAEMETKYQTEKKQHENEILIKDAELQKTKIEKSKRTIFGISGIAGLTLASLLVSIGAYRRKKKANKELAEQKEIIQEKNRNIFDSINYAKKIQNSILPKDEEVKKIIPESFILYKPKDIVSGDFYWVAEKNEKSFFAACDCTGHGVPGAFMSVLSYSLLNEAVNKKEILKPNEIFEDVRDGIINSLKSGDSKDGMDAVLCSIDKKTKTLEFVCANNPLYFIRDDKLIQYKADRIPVGYEEKLKSFTNNKLQFKKNDLIYIFSDGYQDQFGGEKGKKYFVKNFRKLLFEIHKKPMFEQKEILNKTIEVWKGNKKQTDDILIIGTRF